MKRILGLIGGLLVAGLLLLAPVQGQIGQPGVTGQFFEISPVRQELTIEKNTIKVAEVSITNRHIAPISLRTVFENIKADGDDGGTTLTQEPVPWDLKQYTTVGVETFTLQPREVRKIPVTISIPNSAAPGGYYGRLRFTPVERTDLPPVAIQGNIAELFLVRVPGPANEQGNIQDFQFNQEDGSKTSLVFLGTDGHYLTRIHNGGNVHFATAPKVTVTNQFGKTVLDVQAESQNVFPQGDRRFETKWNHISTGYYKATVTADLPNQPNSQRELKFVVVTPRVAIAVLVVLLLAIVWVIRRRRRRASAAPTKQ